MVGPIRPSSQSCQLIPHLVVHDAEQAIAFYCDAFGAEEVYRMATPQGDQLLHVELRVGDLSIYLCDEFPEMSTPSPHTLHGSPVTLHLEVDDVDNWFERAIRAGAGVLAPLDNMFWGQRYGKLIDPFGHHWSIASTVESVSDAEMSERVEEMFAL